MDASLPAKATRETVTGELSTQPGMEVTVTPYGTIKVKKTGDPLWDDEKDEPFVSGSEEENDEAVVRPNRKSRVDDSNTEEPPKSPVAAARKTRRSPLPAPTLAASLAASSSPSKVDLANLIEQSSELEEEDARAELMMIIQAFFLEKRGKL